MIKPEAPQAFGVSGSFFLLSLFTEFFAGRFGRTAAKTLPGWITTIIKTLEFLEPLDELISAFLSDDSGFCHVPAAFRLIHQEFSHFRFVLPSGK